MSPAINRGLRKAARTVMQVVAAGGATVLVNHLADGMGETAKLSVLLGWLLVVTFAQNALETAGRVPVMLPSPGLVVTKAAGAVVDKAVATVPAVATDVGATIDGTTGVFTEVAGPVIDTAGETVGSVTGMVGDLLGDGEETAPKEPPL